MSVILLVIAVRRYYEKRSVIAITLAVVMLYFAVAMAFQVIGEYLSIIGVSSEPNSFTSGNPTWFLNWILALIISNQIAYFFLLAGIFMLHRFALLLSPDTKHARLRDRVALILVIALIVFGTIRLQFPLVNPTDIGKFFYTINVWVVLVAIYMVVPVLAISNRMLAKTRANPVEHKHWTFLAATAWMTLAMIASFVLAVFFPDVDMPGLGYDANFVGFGCAIVGLLFVYLSFYAK